MNVCDGYMLLFGGRAPRRPRRAAADGGCCAADLGRLQIAKLSISCNVFVLWESGVIFHTQVRNTRDAHRLVCYMV